jgi:hypothetical protein
MADQNPSEALSAVRTIHSHRGRSGSSECPESCGRAILSEVATPAVTGSGPERSATVARVPAPAQPGSSTSRTALR